MNTHVFELNCDDSNVRPVEEALAGIGLDYSMMRTAKAAYVLLVRSELSEDEVARVLANAGIKVIKAWGVSL